jgi:hypothetical protein
VKYTLLAAAFLFGKLLHVPMIWSGNVDGGANDFVQ